MKPSPINPTQPVSLSEVKGTRKVHTGTPTHRIGNYAYEIHNVALTIIEGDLLGQYEVYILDSKDENVLVTVLEDYTGTYTYAIESFEDRYKDYYGYDHVELEEAWDVVTALREEFEDFILQNEDATEENIEKLQDKLEWWLNLKLIRMSEV